MATKSAAKWGIFDFLVNQRHDARALAPVSLTLR